MKKKEEIDKGFELFYWNLSYRRKFIRTIWFFLFFIFTMLIIPANLMISLNFKRFIWILLLILFPIQALYNYLKWKNNNMNN